MLDGEIQIKRMKFKEGGENSSQEGEIQVRMEEVEAEQQIFRSLSQSEVSL
jgi:hypothetical protein